jgi:hypothetical protein
VKPRAVAGMLLGIALAIGCAGEPAPASGPPSGALPPPSIGADAAIVDAIRFRTEFGLRADLEFVMAVAVDPRANMDFGVPLLPEEIAEIERRGADAHRIVPIVQEYVADVPNEFGGINIDQANGGRVTVLFTNHLAEHDQALRELLAGVGPVVIRQVQFTEADLIALMERISADDGWFETIDAKLTGVSLDTIGNKVDVEISSTNAAAPGLIVNHFAVPPGVLNVISDGTGAAFVPVVAIRGVVVTADGKPPGNNAYLVIARGLGPGRCGGDVDEMAHGVMPDGAFEIRCAVGAWTLAIQDSAAGPPDGIDLGSVDVVVPPGGLNDVVITLDPSGG